MDTRIGGLDQHTVICAYGRIGSMFACILIYMAVAAVAIGRPRAA